MKTTSDSYKLDAEGRFVIGDYNRAKVFSNFFPGIAGAWGIPMWVFYVNRGQCISSFGVESKDKSILEFQPANKAYRLTPQTGFRTFLKIRSAKDVFYEPFQMNAASSRFATEQKLSLASGDLTIEERNRTLGINVRVNYFTLPEEPFAALVRVLTITNTSKKVLSAELIDGLPAIVPYGTNDWALKNMSRTVEAWMQVSNLKNKAPYYRLKVVVSDNPVVEHISEGNFYFAFERQGARTRMLSPLIEASCVFGACHDFAVPQEFLAQKKFKVPQEQFAHNRTPSAMAASEVRLRPGQSVDVVSFVGYATEETLVNRFAARALQKGFVEEKAARLRDIVEEVKGFAFTHSASREFDLYAGQTFLDNVLRGGLPLSLKTAEGSTVFNVYSRKHGDPERDYNFFVLAPTYFTQGNGNYRDVNQNRRNDVYFNKDVRENSLVNFLSLMQADGYNPLVVKGMTFSAADSSRSKHTVHECVSGHGAETVEEFIHKPFQPGELLKLVAVKNIKLKVSLKEFLSKVLSVCHKNESADHGEGFWTDHWTYNLDLLESFTAVYPEDLRSLLFDKKAFTFYHNAHYLLPRDQRYILTPRGVRQYHSVKDGRKEIPTVHKDNRLRVKNGEGPVYHTHLIGKLLSLIASKAATFDPDGIGIEMEADKPGWCDALNGLPGLLGSSICETFELKRLSRFLREALANEENEDARISVFQELAGFVEGLTDVLASETDPLSYWRKSNDLKEHYRQSVRAGVDGNETGISLGRIRKFLSLVEARAQRGIDLARSEGELFPTYFWYEVTEHETLDKDFAPGQPFVWPLAFQRHALPLYLEGFVHALRVENDPQRALSLHSAVRKSPLFDGKLKMYKVNADLSGESEEIGRCRIFPAGWLENESVWLHMEYKYLLELLRVGLPEEFYRDFFSAFVPFLDPRRYGRSILENSSFIVSSAHPDAKLHGQGFVARLSGSTAEFLHMWLLMGVGARPFRLNEQGALELKFQPLLAAELFSKRPQTVPVFDREGRRHSVTLPANTYAFNFLGGTLVVYHNPKRRDTFGAQSVAIERMELHAAGKRPAAVAGDTFPQGQASEVRERRVERIDIHLS